MLQQALYITFNAKSIPKFMGMPFACVIDILQMLRGLQFLKNLLEKVLSAFLLRMVENLLCCTAFNYASVCHENDIISNLSCKSHLVCNHYHGHSFFCQILHNIKNFSYHLRVQCRCRFVKKKDFRFHCQGSGYGNPLFLSA